MFGGDGFTIQPRKGELIVFDKLARPLLSSIILPVPTARTKGVLVAPTVFGNVLLGPTAEDVTDRSDPSTSAAGLSALLAAGRRILPRLEQEEVTATYAGLRAATEHPDYQVGAHGRYVRVAGIRSTGLTASLGIAEHVAGLLGEAGLRAEAARRRRAGAAPRMPYLGEAGRRPYQDAERIAADPAYGEIACHCERVTRGEIRDALASDLPPGRTRRPAAADPGDERPLPGVLLRRGGVRDVLAGPTPGSGPRAGATVDVDVLVVGAGPGRADGRRRTAPPRRAARPGRRPGGTARRDSPAQLAHRVRAARPAPDPVRPGVRAGPDRCRSRSGAELRTGCTVTDLQAGGESLTAVLTSAAGIEEMRPSAVLLATGCRERPRRGAARPRRPAVRRAHHRRTAAARLRSAVSG